MWLLQTASAVCECYSLAMSGNTPALQARLQQLPKPDMARIASNKDDGSDSDDDVGGASASPANQVRLRYYVKK